MSNPKLFIGAAVKLNEFSKAEQPKMIILSIAADHANVIFFDTHHKMHKASIPLELLTTW